MNFISALIPTNLNEEKEKFFNDNTYNPQFVYEEEIPEEKLYKHGHPNEEFSQIANEIMEKTFFGRNEHDLFMMEGPLVTQSYVEKTVKTFLHMHQLHKRFNIVWSSSFLSRTSINSNTIKLQLPVSFRKEGLLGMLYHEVGTHALRTINYEQQPWYRRKSKFGFSDYLKTEEGLATLHALIPHSYKGIFVSATRHVAVTIAQQCSFAETWQKLGKYVQDDERRWSITTRQKRGLTDTSKPGGFTKDMVYFEGFIEVWRWLRDNDFDPTNLYYGKMAKEDIGLAQEHNPGFIPQLPSFFTLSKSKYAEEISEIGKFNGLE